MKKTLIALTLAATAVAGIASAANVNSFEQFGNIDAATYADLGMVRAAADGVVEVTDIAGNVLGTAPVAAGVTGNLRVELARNVTVGKVVAQLKIGGETVASQLYTIAN